MYLYRMVVPCFYNNLKFFYLVDVNFSTAVKKSTLLSENGPKTLNMFTTIKTIFIF